MPRTTILLCIHTIMPPKRPLRQGQRQKKMGGQGFSTIAFLNFWIPEFPNCWIPACLLLFPKIHWIFASWIPGLSNSLIFEFLNSQIPKFLNSRVSESLNFWILEFLHFLPEFLNIHKFGPEIQEFGNSRVSEFLNFWISGLNFIHHLTQFL